MKHKHKIQKNDYQKPLTVRLIERFSLYFFLLLAVALTLFLAGNYQKFLDTTQRNILYFGIFQAASLFVFCIAGLFSSIIMLIKSRQKRYILQFIFYIVGLIIAPVIMIVIHIFSFIEGGI